MLNKANNESIQARKNENADKLLGLYFPVLDHGFVSLVDYMGNDSALAQAARTSYGAGTRIVSDNRALIRYLVRHKHTSPIEQVELKFHIKAPIFVFRQWHRHRTASLNEMSGRYSIMPLQFYTPEQENLKQQSKNNKQGRDGEVDASRWQRFVDEHSEIREVVKDCYVGDLKDDIARELARIDLPLSTYSEMYWKMDLHNLMHLLKLRCDSHAQFEIRQYANVIAGIVAEVCPLAFEAWQDYVYESVNFSYHDMVILRELMTTMAQQRKIEDFFPGNDEIKKYAEDHGVSVREVTELFSNLSTPKEKQDFKIDFSKAKSPEYFLSEAQKAVPIINSD